MKKIFGILFIFSFVCGYSQVFDFPHRIYSLETKFLKILYTEESSESALLLFQKGDGIYEKCAALTGRKKNTKIPVILTSDEKILNGYYTPYPGTRIVINDTIPGSGELLVFNDTLLGVFTHELTHALGAENRDSFFGFLSAVFGDYVIPSYGFNLPLFLVEGLAVYGETSVLSGFYGFPQGRLNDSSYEEKLVLAKSLGDFPSWQEVSGAGNEYALSVSLRRRAGMSKDLILAADMAYFPETKSIGSGVDFQFKCRGEWRKDALKTVASLTLRGMYDVTSSFRAEWYAGLPKDVNGSGFAVNVRADVSLYSGLTAESSPVGCGRAVSAEGSYRVAGRFSSVLAVYARLALFHCDGWGERIYCYERDLYGSMSVPALYGKGLSSYLMAVYRPCGWLKLSFKAGVGWYNRKKEETCIVDFKFQCEVSL